MITETKSADPKQTIFPAVNCACAENRHQSTLPAQLTAAAAAAVLWQPITMADSVSSEEVAVISNTDITSTESENNIINTVVPFVVLRNNHT